MIRSETQHGWWLITQAEHARLAAAFAREWGNAELRSPEPRTRVQRAITNLDYGWRERDNSPTLAPDGKPSAFSAAQLGQPLSWDEINFDTYLNLRARAVRAVAGEGDAYAALLIALYNEDHLTRLIRRENLTPQQLTVLDRFLREEESFQQQLLDLIEDDAFLMASEKQSETIQENFRLLHGCQYLSLLSCLAFDQPFPLPQPLALRSGGSVTVHVRPLAPRQFQVTPWPFAAPELRLEFSAHRIIGHVFTTQESFVETFRQAPTEILSVRLSA